MVRRQGGFREELRMEKVRNSLTSQEILRLEDLQHAFASYVRHTSIDHLCT